MVVMRWPGKVCVDTRESWVNAWEANSNVFGEYYWFVPEVFGYTRTKYTHYRNLSVLAAVRKSCRLMQNKTFFTTSHGLNVKCFPLAPVSNVSHRLLALNIWPQQVTLSGKIAYSLGGEILLKEVVTEGGPWSFIVEPHFLFKYKLCFLRMVAQGPRSPLQLLPCLPCLRLCFLHHDRLDPFRVLSSSQPFLP